MSVEKTYREKSVKNTSYRERSVCEKRVIESDLSEKKEEFSFYLHVSFELDVTYGYELMAVFYASSIA